MKMSDILEYILNMIPYMLLALPIILVTRIIAFFLHKKKNIWTTWEHEVAICLFLLFIVGLASQTIIPKFEIAGNEIHILHTGISGRINFIPGQVFADTWQAFNNGYPSYFIINFLGNIGMFIPIGFLVPLLWNRSSVKKIALIALSISLFIEICQIPQARGSDVDDLWLNTLGGVIGALLYYGLTKIPALDRAATKFKMKRNHF